MPSTPDVHASSALQRLIEARHHDPSSLLGRHEEDGVCIVRALIPGARRVSIEPAGRAMERVPGTDLFVWQGEPGEIEWHYRLAWTNAAGHAREEWDPYCFGPQLPAEAIDRFSQGRNHHAQELLGARPVEIDGVAGTLFATWAPNAERVSVIGDFNAWDGRRHPMRCRGGSGVWELFIPGLGAGTLYKLELRNNPRGTIHVKSDPYARRFELRPATASVVQAPSTHQWGDGDWMAGRDHWLDGPVSVYEVHLGSWRRDAGGGFLNYRELARQLVDHLHDTGFTHVELLPVTEHPLDASWGYQTVGYFAPTSRHGSPDDFRYFVDHLHRNGIGVYLDWVPGHFPKDAHGLARFDGSAAYEHEDPRLGEQRDWGTLIFNYGRTEVRSFLISSALFWLESFHVDGLRVDAVASMLYLDYSRQPGDWIPNRYGGNENLEAVEFLRELNSVTHGRCPGSVMVAEESTAWPQVTRPTWLGGLGFSMKWNMGWMHDTLVYMTRDPIYRHYHHDILTFGLLYAFTENFVLPFSHDEVVHGKGSMLGKMPGDAWQKLANLRLLYSYMFTYPGKKLLFMGSEFAVENEWDHERALDWARVRDPGRARLLRLVADLNALYRGERALHRRDFEGAGFEWIDCHDAAQSVISYIRRDGPRFVVVALNFTPVPREGYRIGVPVAGPYAEALNSDSAHYGGSNVGNLGRLEAVSEPWMGRPCSLTLRLPPLGALVLRPEAAAPGGSAGPA